MADLVQLVLASIFMKRPASVDSPWIPPETRPLDSTAYCRH